MCIHLVRKQTLQYLCISKYEICISKCRPLLMLGKDRTQPAHFLFVSSYNHTRAKNSVVRGCVISSSKKCIICRSLFFTVSNNLTVDKHWAFIWSSYIKSYRLFVPLSLYDRNTCIWCTLKSFPISFIWS